MTLDEVNPKKGTYAAVRLSEASTDALQKWAKACNIPNILPAKKMHVTLLYSRRHCPNYVPAGKIDPPWIGKVKAKDVFMTRPTDGSEPSRCLVLKLDCLELFNRHLTLMNEHNATYDFPLYMPHVSISYNMGDVDVLTLPKYDGPIEIVEEYGEDLDLNWAVNQGIKKT